MALRIGHFHDDGIARAECQVHAMMIAAIHEFVDARADHVALLVGLGAFRGRNMRAFWAQREHRFVAREQTVFAAAANDGAVRERERRPVLVVRKAARSSLQRMTTQIPETLHYRGREYSMWSCPSPRSVEGVIDFDGFNETTTALRRGYYGAWAIEDGKLYLTKIHGTLLDGREASLDLLVPGCKRRAFAKSFTGNLDCPIDNADHEIHSCDRLLRLRVEHGVVVAEEELDRDALEHEQRMRARR